MKLKGKQFDYFRHPEGFDQDYFDHLKERLSAEFSKIIRPL